MCHLALDEAKKFIPMGAPLFQYEKILEENEAEIFSSNYELYGDMSERVMNSLQSFTPEVEIYSIDEAFLGLQQTQKGFDYIGKEIQEKIFKWTNIPSASALPKPRRSPKLPIGLPRIQI
jgi:DNA polymerase V